MKIYIAGPDVFRADAQDHFHYIKKLCEAYGHEALIPTDNEVSEGLEKKEKGREIFVGNINMMDQAEVVFANIEPFRGACMDDGTAFEVGYCYAKEKRIIAYSTCKDLQLHEVTSQMFDLSKQDKYSEIEDFGNCVNLMISNAIELQGGDIFTNIEECLYFLNAADVQ
ncbi:MAG: nucleoside 2-deoxyribosyltransferase [Cytophagaceae bacterium]